MTAAPPHLYPDTASELLPCPFCGEKRISFNEPTKKYRYGSINCPGCLVTMPGEVRDQDELIGCWNAREPVLTGLQEDLILMSFHNEPTPQPGPVAQAAVDRDAIAAIIRDKVDYFLADTSGPLVAAEAIIACFGAVAQSGQRYNNPLTFLPVNDLVLAIIDKPCAQQFDLASKVAENVGYVLTREPDHPDSPHAVAQAPTVRLEARPADDSHDWTEIYPAQLQALAKYGLQVRAIEIAQAEKDQIVRALDAAVHLINRYRQVTDDIQFERVMDAENDFGIALDNVSDAALVVSSTDRHCEFCHVPMPAADCCDSEFEAKGCPHYSTDRVNLPGHDETMANLNALTIGGTNFCGHGVMAATCTICHMWSQVSSPSREGQS